MYSIRVLPEGAPNTVTRKRGRPKMSPTNVTETEVNEIPVQRTRFDLDNMEEVTVKKTVPFTNVTKVEDALALLGNNTEKLVEVINRGLRAEVGAKAVNDPAIPWMIENEEGDLVPFTGTLVNATDVNVLVLNLAKQVFGYSKDKPIEVRKAAKESAKNFIKTSDVIREGFKKQALASSTTETEA